MPNSGFGETTRTQPLPPVPSERLASLEHFLFKLYAVLGCIGLFFENDSVVFQHQM